MDTVIPTIETSKRGDHCSGIVIGVNLDESTLHIRQTEFRRNKQIVKTRAIIWYFLPYQIFEDSSKRKNAKTRFKKIPWKRGDQVQFMVFDQDRRLAHKVKRNQRQETSVVKTVISQGKPRIYQGEVVGANQKDSILEIGFFGKDHFPGGPFVYTIGHFRPLENIEDPEKQKKMKAQFVRSSWRVGQDVEFEMFDKQLDSVHKVQKKEVGRESGRVKSEGD